MKSTVTEIKYGRKFNLGDYQSEEISLVAALEPGEDALEALAELKGMVMAAHEGEESTTNAQPSKEAVEEEDKQPEDGGSDDEPSTQDDDDARQESESQEDEGEVQESKAGKGSSKAKGQGKPSSQGSSGRKAKTKVGGKLDRNNTVHKDLFGKLLDEKYDGWRQSAPKKAKASKILDKLNGTEFLDGDGEILMSFKKEVAKLFALKL